MEHYERVIGNLSPGKEAQSEDINHIQSNIEDGFNSLINDLHDGTSFILGSDKESFLISPATKRSNLYIDTQNQPVSENYIALSTKNIGYKQKIRKSKTSIYSINVKLRNLYNKPVVQWFELRDPNNNNTLIAKQSIQIPAGTDMDEFEVTFGQYYLPTALGVSSMDAEKGDVDIITDESVEKVFDNDYDGSTSGSMGISEYDFIVRPINLELSDISINGDEDITITSDTFAIFADSTGTYGKCLYSTNNDGLTYDSTIYDLVFKDVYATAPTYICNGGSAIIDGHRVESLMSHIEIQTGSSFGDVISLIYMDIDGFYNVATSDAFLDTEYPAFQDLEDKFLPIAIIKTYMLDDKPPEIIQDDENQITRPRSIFERVNAIQKKQKYNEDLNIPPRIKATLPNNLLLADPCQDVPCNDGDPCVGIEDGKFTLTTDSKGSITYKSTASDIFNIDIDFKNNITNNTGLQAAKNITKNNHIDIDTSKGIVTLDTYKTKQTKEVSKKTTTSAGNNVITEKTTSNTGVNVAGNAISTVKIRNGNFDPWKLVNSPDTKSKSKERAFITYSGVTSLNQKKLSEYPAMTMWVPKTSVLLGITIPIVKFKNMKNFKIAIFERQSKNDLENTVWLGKKVYESAYVSLDKATKQNDYQVLRKPHTFKLGKNGIKFTKKQYVVVIYGNPINKSGAIITSTIPTLKKRDFLIKYVGTTQAQHFRLKGRAFETWAIDGNVEADLLDYYTDGSIESGIVNFSDTNNFNISNANIQSIIPTGTISTPKGCSYQLWVKTNSVDWTKATLGKSLKISGTQFQWKLDLKGTDDSTPKIDVSSSTNGYGLRFSITMDSLGSLAGGAFDDTGECLTTRMIKGNDILSQYINDPNADFDNFSRYEFIRLWAEENAGKIICDIHGSNKTEQVDFSSISECNTNSYPVDVCSLIYADLSLDDFDYKSVDYSEFDPAVEYDEHNFRLKLDSETAYNDSDIIIFNSNNWLYNILSNNNENNKFSTDGTKIIVNNEIDDNTDKILSKIQPNNFVNLTNFSALKLDIQIDSETLEDNTVSGLGFYISLNNETDAPIFNEIGVGDIINGKKVIREENILPPNLNLSTEDQVNYYFDKILEILIERNGITYKVYYEYYLDPSGQYQYRIIHDIRSYIFYDLPDLNVGENTIYIPIDKDNNWFTYVKEIGIVATKDFSTEENIDITPKQLGGQKLGYNKIFNGNDFNQWIISNSQLTQDGYLTKSSANMLVNGQGDNVLKLQLGNSTKKISVQENRDTLTNKQLMYLNNDSFTQNFGHLGLQIATSHYLYKGMLRLNFHDARNGEGNILFSLDIPSLNYVQNPLQANMHLTQIYKKISENYIIRSLSISTGPTFSTKMGKILGSSTVDSFTLYINDIILYEANTMPIFHKNIKAKIYSHSEDGSYNVPTIRKFGVVATFN